MTFFFHTYNPNPKLMNSGHKNHLPFATLSLAPSPNFIFPKKEKLLRSSSPKQTNPLITLCADNKSPGSISRAKKASCTTIRMTNYIWSAAPRRLEYLLTKRRKKKRQGHQNQYPASPLTRATASIYIIRTCTKRVYVCVCTYTCSVALTSMNHRCH